MQDQHIVLQENNNPFFSIILPVFNAEKYLKKCIVSILMQSFKNYEVIIINDGSTDSSASICQHYSRIDPRINVYNQDNQGSFCARLFGISKAKGEYLLFCDADDYYAKDHAFFIINRFLCTYNIDALQFGYRKKYNHLLKNVRPVNSPLLVTHEDFVKMEYPKLICSFWPESHLTPSLCNKAVHKSLFENILKIKSPERLFWGDDLITNLHTLETCHDMLFIPDMLYVYRQFCGSTSEFRKNTMSDLDIIKKHQLEFIERSPCDKSVLKSIAFSEMAGWLYLWVHQASSFLDEEELLQELGLVLHLPRFILATEYYRHHHSNSTLPIDLLRCGDANKYMLNIKKESSETKSLQSFISKTRNALIRIYQRI